MLDTRVTAVVVLPMVHVFSTQTVAEFYRHRSNPNLDKTDLAYKDRTAPNSRFLRFLRIIRREARDDRHFVKKGVNCALRNIGKRNRALDCTAIRTARQLRGLDSAAARWIAADALRELTSPPARRRLPRARAQ
jgi:hypothetical protein